MSRFKALPVTLALGVVGLLSSAATAIIVTDTPAPGSGVVAQGFSAGNAEVVVVSTITGAKRECWWRPTLSPPSPSRRPSWPRTGAVWMCAWCSTSRRRGERYTASSFLKNQGVPVRISRKYAIMHNKFMVIDGATVETGSFNYTSSAANKNAENALVLRDSATAATYARTR